MRERIKRLLKKIVEIFYGIISGGVISFGIFLYFAPSVDKMIHDSGGLCVVIFVMIFFAGSIISSVIYWIVTGRSLLDVLFSGNY